MPPSPCRKTARLVRSRGSAHTCGMADSAVRRYVALALFGIAFGVEEAIIVLYLRQLPATYDAHAYALEMGREFCTLVVIGAIAALAGRSWAKATRAFCFAFGAWDITYYVALWQLSGVPRLTDSDILFLIPVPWFAPVWAPMAFAALLMIIGIVGVARERAALLAAGYAIALFSFVYETIFKTSAYPMWLFLIAFALAVSGLPYPAPVMLRRERVR